MSKTKNQTIRNDLTAIVISVVSVSFGMISAYIAGLWLFLREAPLSLRVLAFFLLSCGLAFMGALTWGVNDLLVGTEQAWAKLTSPASGISGFGNARPEWLHGLSLYDGAVFLGATAFAAIYVSLAYLTFVYKWPGATAGPVRVAP